MAAGLKHTAVEFAAHHLGGRVMPDDLRRLLNLLEYEPASRRAKCLNRLGVVFPESDRLPALIDAESRGRDDLEGITRLAYAQAMAGMVRYSGFVAETVDGSAIGYWFGPDQIQIEAAPLMRFDTSGSFSILRGNGIAEAILALASYGNDGVFCELRECLAQQGLTILARSINDLQQPKCAVFPQAIYEQLIKTYLTDLSAASVPDIGDPANIMTTHRGPQLRG